MLLAWNPHDGGKRMFGYVGKNSNLSSPYQSRASLLLCRMYLDADNGWCLVYGIFDLPWQ